MSLKNACVKNELKWEDMSEAAAPAPATLLTDEVNLELDARHKVKVEVTADLETPELINQKGAFGAYNVKVEVELEPEPLKSYDKVYSVEVSAIQEIKQEPQDGSWAASVPMGPTEARPDGTLQPQLADQAPHLYKINHKTFELQSSLSSYSYIVTEESTPTKQISNNTLQTYTETLKTEKSFSCDGCNKQFRRKHNLERHILVHTGEKPHSCGICDKQFADKPNLAKHMETHTGGKHKHSCDICSKQFRRKYYLEQHKRLHMGAERPSCHVCKKQFTVISNLTQHMRIHTGEKPLSCEICNKQFRHRNHLVVHKLIHTGEKPHSCQICKKQFAHKSNLTKHLRVHTGDKKVAT